MVWCDVAVFVLVVSVCLFLCSGCVCFLWEVLCDVVCGVVGCVVCGSCV